MVAFSAIPEAEQEGQSKLAVGLSYIVGSRTVEPKCEILFQNQTTTTTANTRGNGVVVHTYNPSMLKH